MQQRPYGLKSLKYLNVWLFIGLCTHSYSRPHMLACDEIPGVQLPYWAQISVKPFAIFL